MFELSRREINELADNASFIRDTTEKVLRLFSFLRFLEESPVGCFLALKGGTAINLFLLDLPRLSVDIDLDFCLPVSKEEMLEKRKKIDKEIRDFMADEGYFLSDRSKFYFTLDSYVYSYVGSSGNRDVIKIEINYSDRFHVLKTEKRVSTGKLGKPVSAMILSEDELIGSKMSALLGRTSPRDIYDVWQLFCTGLVKNKEAIRKIALFYTCLSADIPVDFPMILENALNQIDSLTYQKAKETLVPVLHKGLCFDIKEMTDCVGSKIKEFFGLDEKDKEFIQRFNRMEFRPDLLFQGWNTEDVCSHPMGLWKTGKGKDNK